MQFIFANEELQNGDDKDLNAGKLSRFITKCAYYGEHHKWQQAHPSNDCQWEESITLTPAQCIVIRQRQAVRVIEETESYPAKVRIRRSDNVGTLQSRCGFVCVRYICTLVVTERISVSKCADSCMYLIITKKLKLAIQKLQKYEIHWAFISTYGSAHGASLGSIGPNLIVSSNMVSGRSGRNKLLSYKSKPVIRS